MPYLLENARKREKDQALKCYLLLIMNFNLLKEVKYKF